MPSFPAFGPSPEAHDTLVRYHGYRNCARHHEWQRGIPAWHAQVQEAGDLKK